MQITFALRTCTEMNSLSWCGSKEDKTAAAHRGRCSRCFPASSHRSSASGPMCGRSPHRRRTRWRCGSAPLSKAMNLPAAMTTMAVAVGGTTPDSHGRPHGLRLQRWPSPREEALWGTILLGASRKTWGGYPEDVTRSVMIRTIP